ncbi:MAG: sodium-dependent transporter [Bacteroidaceae bacterium]|nr:sodium-dependent transporter [Bacteroidaceae bacterium]
MAQSRGNFSGRLGLILASAGSAVGLGNLWRFPTECGNNGGSAFLLVYLLCVVVFGLPVMVSEFMIGRSSRVSVGRAYEVLAPGTPWKWTGRMQVLTPLLILCFYNVVAGWTLWYTGAAAINTFPAMADGGKDAFEGFFAGFVGSWWKQGLCLVVFSLLTHWVIVQGVSKGIERASKLLMPGLFLLLLLLVGSAMFMPGTAAGLSFLFKPDFTKIDSGVVLSAMGQAFFSLSLGMGILTTYASYFRDDADLGKSALSVCIIDTLVALLCGMFIFPTVFTAGIEPSEGPGLLFVALPGVFQEAFGGQPVLSYAVSLCFFVLLVLATLTSAISVHEAITSYAAEAFRLSRRTAARWVTAITTTLGMLCALSLGAGAQWLTWWDKPMFDWFDFVTAKWMLPLAGFFISVYAGWFLSKRVWWTQMTNSGTRRFPFFGVFFFMARWVCPIGILLVFLNELGLLKLL